MGSATYHRALLQGIDRLRSSPLANGSKSRRARAPLSPNRDISNRDISNRDFSNRHVSNPATVDETEWFVHGDPAPAEVFGPFRSHTQGERSYHFMPPPKLSSNLFNLVQLPWRLSRIGADLHHATLNFQAPLVTPCPLVVTLHDLIPITHPQFVTRRYSRLFSVLIEPVLRRASRIIVFTEVGRRETAVHDREIARKLRVVPVALPEIPLPSPDPHQRKQRLAQLQLPEDFLLFIGPPEPRKNLGVLLNAIHDLAACGVETLPLVVVGRASSLDAPTRDLIERTPGVFFTGYLDPLDLQRVLQGCRGLLFPSFAEGFGYPPVEAMACGKPVVASHIPVLEEVLGDGARFVHPRDVGGWGEAIRWLSDGGQEVEALIARGRRQSQQYSVGRLGAETLTVYEEALTEAQRARPNATLAAPPATSRIPTATRFPRECGGSR